MFAGCVKTVSMLCLCLGRCGPCQCLSSFSFSVPRAVQSNMSQHRQTRQPATQPNEKHTNTTNRNDNKTHNTATRNETVCHSANRKLVDRFHRFFVADCNT